MLKKPGKLAPKTMTGIPASNQNPKKTQSPETPFKPIRDKGEFAAKEAPGLGLSTDRENVRNYYSEHSRYNSDGTLGPTSHPNNIRALQETMKAIGLPVEVNGQYDAATIEEVLKYKKAHGLHQTYKMADESWAVNEYADVQTQRHMLAKWQESQ
jgi:hypothetical protein